jgi:hypothetical protein
MTTTAVSGNNVVVTWNSSPNSYSSTVTAYKITFKKHDGTYAELASCPGTLVGADPNAAASKTCTVLMSELTSSPFLLVQDEKIIARV